MNSFLGLSIGTKALSASQTALNTIDHNISNAKTTGYSRQVVTQKASTALSTSNGSGMIGTGVSITSIVRVRNEFLDKRYWNQSTISGEWSTKSSALSELESLVNSSSTDGLDDVLSSFLSSLEDLSDDPSGDSTRTAVVEEGAAFCKYLNNMASTMQNLLDDNNSCIKTDVDQINSYAKQICDLNKQIFKSELDGSVANDLRDQRTVLVDKLSSIADVQVSESNPGTNDAKYSVRINGIDLVNHYDYNELECYTKSDGTYGVQWAETKNKVTFTGGSIKGYIDVAASDGTNDSFKGIPYYIDKLNTFARTFAEAFNKIHAGGVGSDDSTGVSFFSYDGLSSENLSGNSSNITAFNISLTSDVKNDTDKIATALESGEDENSDNLTKLINMFSDTSVFENGSPEDNVNSIFTTMGVEVSYASTMSTSNNNILENIDTNRSSVSGVSLNEESTNLIIYQQVYNAASKAISVMDAILDVTINSLGSDW